MAKKTPIALARTGHAARAPAEAKKKITHQAIVWVTAVSTPASNSQAVIASRTPDPT